MSHDPALREMARAAREKAYAPYSHFAVGAAVEMEGGARFAGANVENAAYPQSICAERSALAAAASAGHRSLQRVYVYTEEGASPCGGCRSVMAEFGSHDTQVIIGNATGQELLFTLDELLPHAFELGDSLPFPPTDEDD